MSGLIKLDDSGLVKSLTSLESLSETHQKILKRLDNVEQSLKVLTEKVEQLPGAILELVKTHLQQTTTHAHSIHQPRSVSSLDDEVVRPDPALQDAHSTSNSQESATSPVTVVVGIDKVPQGTSKRPRRSSSVSHFSDDAPEVEGDELLSAQNVEPSLPTKHKKAKPSAGLQSSTDSGPSRAPGGKPTWTGRPSNVKQLVGQASAKSFAVNTITDLLFSDLASDEDSIVINAPSRLTLEQKLDERERNGVDHTKNAPGKVGKYLAAKAEEARKTAKPSTEPSPKRNTGVERYTDIWQSSPKRNTGVEKHNNGTPEGVSSSDGEVSLLKFQPRKQRLNKDEQPAAGGLIRATEHIEKPSKGKKEAAASQPFPVPPVSTRSTRPTRDRKKPDAVEGMVPTPDFSKGKVRDDFGFRS